ncbi:MAG: helix-turn-helix domain-containing protein [Anaerolineaceae bacterium]|nr:helix-turn-helix domain-containing protein [Anaerolineaceae bacterium]
MPSESSKLWTDDFYQAVDPQVRVVGYMAAEAGQHYQASRSLVPDFDLWYMTAGSGSVLIDDRWVDFAEGDLLVIKPGQHYHADRADAENPFRQYWVHVLPFGGRRPELSRPLASLWPTVISVTHLPSLGELFADLFETFTAKPQGYALGLKALMHQVLGLLFPLLRQPTRPHVPPGYAGLLKARDFVEQHCRRDLTLDEVAEQADLSASYLLALFKRFLGCSPMQYQRTLRLRSAKVLLARGTSVTETARQVGFNSLHYFSRIFSRQEGMTARGFAEQCRRK